MKRMGTKNGAGSARSRRRQVRQFERFYDQSEEALIERFGEEAAAQMRREVIEEYQRLVPHVPYVGGRENPMVPAMAGTPMALAVYRVVRAHGGEVEDVGDFFHRFLRAGFGQVPGVLRSWMGRYVFSGRFRRRYAKGARRSQARRYPDDWVFEMVDGDGESFEFGYDITECGISKFLRAHDADDLTPYICDLDNVKAELLGYRLDRTKTLAWGCDRCDFRYSRHGLTSAPWPPAFPERTCGGPQSTPAS